MDEKGKNTTKMSEFRRRLYYVVGIIGGLIIYAILQTTIIPDDLEQTEPQTNVIAVEQAEVEVVERVAAEAKEAEIAKAEAEKDAESAKKAEELAKQKEVDGVLAIFPELESEIVKITDGVITEVDVEYLTSYFKVSIYVDETTWAYSSESEKLSFATSFGNMIVNRIPINTVVDFRSALNRDVVAEGKVFGGYKIKR